eukprot:6180258-Pleurochrysis_carterae.AAC.2
MFSLPLTSMQMHVRVISWARSFIKKASFQHKLLKIAINVGEGASPAREERARSGQWLLSTRTGRARYHKEAARRRGTALEIARSEATWTDPCPPQLMHAESASQVLA